MLRTILIASAATVLIQAATAQNQLNLQPVQNKLHGTYSMTHGFQPAPPIAQRTGPVKLYDNNDGDELWYSTGVQTAPGVIQTWTIDDELIDQIAFPLAGINNTEQLNGITINYCSDVPDPNSTQDVLPINLYIYEDFEDLLTGSTSPTGWPIAKCEYMFLLPGVDPATGLAGCWEIIVDLGFGLECTVPQDTTGVGLEPIGLGWTYGDPRPSPAGGSGPVVDNVLTNLPGYGALDETRMHVRTTQSYLFAMIGNGADFFNSHIIEVEGQTTDTEAYYHVDPVTQAFAPRAGNSLELQVDTAVRPGAIVTFSVVDYDPLLNYTLLISRAPADIAVTLTAPTIPVQASLLIDMNLLAVNPLPMSGGTSGPLFVPLGLPQSTLYIQAAEHTGNLGVSRILAGSNGLKSTIQ